MVSNLGFPISGNYDFTFCGFQPQIGTLLFWNYLKSNYYHKFDGLLLGIGVRCLLATAGGLDSTTAWKEFVSLIKIKWGYYGHIEINCDKYFR